MFTGRLSVSISPRNLYNSLKGIKEVIFFYFQRMRNIFRPDVKLPGDRSDAPPPYSEVSMRVTSDGAVHV